MGSAVKAITKPFENLFQGVGSFFKPEMPEIPAPAPVVPAEPAGPGETASDSSAAQEERLRVAGSRMRKKTQTLFSGSQGLSGSTGSVKKLLGGSGQ